MYFWTRKQTIKTKEGSGARLRTHDPVSTTRPIAGSVASCFDADVPLYHLPSRAGRAIRKQSNSGSEVARSM